MAKQKGLAASYLLSLLGFVGFAGIHRFYLGKPVSGFFYLITGGFAGIGTIFDLIFMPKLVAAANRERYIDEKLSEDYEARGQSQERPQDTEAKNLEHLMFILAEKNQGILSAALLALESGIAAEQADAELEKMVLQGYAVPGQRKNGLKVYVFREFLSPEMEAHIIF